MACSMDSARCGLVRRRTGRGDEPFVDVRMRVLKELRRQPLGGASLSSSEKKKLMSSRGTTLLLSSTKAVMMETEPQPSSPRSPLRTLLLARSLRAAWRGARTRWKTSAAKMDDRGQP